MTRIHLIDYGVGNIHNVQRALKHIGADVVMATKAADLVDAEAIILPGVGAFADCVSALRDQQFEPFVLEHIANNKLLLGICVGMQMLANASEEFGHHKGLGVISGTVQKIQTPPDHEKVKVPHIAWQGLYANDDPKIGWQQTPLSHTQQGDDVYFVHSYAFHCDDPNNELAYSTYQGVKVTAVVREKNTYGMQFHPEKSGKIGLTILRTFVEMAQNPHAVKSTDLHQATA